MIGSYLYLKQLPDEVKKRHKIKLESKTPRLDLLAYAGYYPPLERLKSSKGQIFFNLLKTDGIINSPDNRRAGYSLQCSSPPAPIKSVNFSSIFILEAQNNDFIIAYGEPPQGKLLKPAKGKDGKPIQRQNPFFENANDGYLFLISLDYTTIEILVIPDGRYLIKSYAIMLIDGKLSGALETIRNNTKPFFNY
jgi:hypothetical protein